MTVTASYGWDDLAAVITLTGDAQHRHIPGSPMEWEHGYDPVSPAAAASHFRGKPPKGWKPRKGKTVPKPAEAPKTASGAPAKVTAGDLTKIRKQTGLDMGHPDAYRLGAARPDYAEALSHLAAGRNTEAQAAMDRMVVHAQAMKGPEGRHAAATAVSMRDKVRGATGKAAEPKPAAVTAPRAVPAADAEWKRTMDEMAAKSAAAGVSNAKAMDRNHALGEARKAHMREATGGITFPHPGDLGGHPGDNGAWQASEHFAKGNLPEAASALDRQAAGETSKARAAKSTKLAAQLRATTLKPTLPALAKVPGTQKPDKSFTALDHNGNEYQVRLRPVSLGKSEVTVSRGGRSATAPAGDDPTRTARVLAARMAPGTDTETQDAKKAAAAGRMLTDRQSEVLKQENDRMTAQAGEQFRRAQAKGSQQHAASIPAVELSARTPKGAPVTVKAKAKAPPAPPAAPPRRSRVTPLTPLRAQAAKSMSKLADSVQHDHPDLSVHEHVRDAARMLRAGNEEASQRHLRAAMFALTPQSLMRNGQHTDDAHLAARQAVHGVHRHLLLVKDIADVAAKNQQALMRDSYGDGSADMKHPDPNAGYGPGANAQKPTARQPGGDKALNAPGRTGSGGPDLNVAEPKLKMSKQFTRNGAGAVTELAYGWGDLDALVVELSADTARLASTPAPIGKPGGPGLYHVAGLGHSDYFQNVRNGLMKRGMDEGKASAMTWGILRRWAAGGGKVTPEVRAAAAKAITEEEAKAHAHSVTWDDVASVLEMAIVRVPAGSAGGGQFGSGGGAPVAQVQAAPPANVARAQQKAALLTAAKNDRAKAAALMAQRKVLATALASAGGKVKKAQAGAKTKASASKTKTTAPPVTSAAGIAKATATAKAAALPKKMSKRAQLTAQVATLTTQISGLLAQAAAATAQAARL